MGGGGCSSVPPSKRRVSFDLVHIREYPIVLSDNPASRSGPSIELGWEYLPASNVEGLTSNDGSISVHDYEAIKPSQKRRPMEKLHLRLYQRLYRVKIHDFSEHDIYAAEVEKEKIRKSRDRSNAFRNPLTRIEWNATVRSMKIRTAVRNANSTKKRSTNIYRGWWNPW